jgi:hypothetical protein
MFRKLDLFPSACEREEISTVMVPNKDQTSLATLVLVRDLKKWGPNSPHLANKTNQIKKTLFATHLELRTIDKCEGTR